MKNYFLTLVCLLLTTMAFSQTKPKFGDGVTFQRNTETLDFYNDGSVIYKSGDAPSRRGEWSVNLYGKKKQLGNVTENVPITVTIYVSDRKVELKGYINYHVGNGTPIKSLILNNETWRKW
ncbi:MAG: hypothetical protein K2G91_01220 [Prevotella sp.]|nr:hypothetical protein [Prevotella sp.]